MASSKLFFSLTRVTPIVEPSLEHLGRVFTEIAQDTYTAHKVFRIVNPNNLDEEKAVEINVPIYNDFGRAVEKYLDYATTKFDVRMVAGSTMPVNRWALIDEYFKWFQAGLIDDIAMISETDIRGKENIIKRKSLYSQLQGQLGQLEEAIKDKDGTIETLERQLVQAGIKQKVMQADVEINKKKEEIKSGMNEEFTQTEGEQKLLRGLMKGENTLAKQRVGDILQNFKNDLDNTTKEE